MASLNIKFYYNYSNNFYGNSNMTALKYDSCFDMYSVFVCVARSIATCVMTLQHFDLLLVMMAFVYLYLIMFYIFCSDLAHVCMFRYCMSVLYVHICLLHQGFTCLFTADWVCLIYKVAVDCVDYTVSKSPC